MEKVYNSLANNPRLLVLDSRSLQSYNAGHIKGSFCVTLSSDGKSLQKLAGSPWSSKCWWDRDVLLVTSTASPSPSQSPSSSKKKKRRLEEKSSDADVVLQFLSKESLVKSLVILGGDDTATTIIEIRNGNESGAKIGKSQLGMLRRTHFPLLQSSIHFLLQNHIKQSWFPDIHQRFYRSACIWVTWRMQNLSHNWKSSKLVMYLKERRNQVNPNRGFISALHQYQKDLLCLLDKATLNSATQVCSAFKAKNNTGSVHESQIEIQKDGSCLGFITLLAGRPTIFGRASSCDVVLDHASISRQHAKMEVVGNTLILTDLRSCHGTFLNGKLLESGQKIVLIDLDDVRFGASTRSYILRKRGY